MPRHLIQKVWSPANLDGQRWMHQPCGRCVSSCINIGCMVSNLRSKPPCHLWCRGHRMRHLIQAALALDNYPLNGRCAKVHLTGGLCGCVVSLTMLAEHARCAFLYRQFDGVFTIFFVIVSTAGWLHTCVCMQLLLMSDGSVTRHLQLLTGSAVQVVGGGVLTL